MSAAAIIAATNSVRHSLHVSHKHRTRGHHGHSSYSSNRPDEKDPQPTGEAKRELIRDQKRSEQEVESDNLKYLMGPATFEAIHQAGVHAYSITDDYEVHAARRITVDGYYGYDFGCLEDESRPQDLASYRLALPKTLLPGINALRREFPQYVMKMHGDYFLTRAYCNPSDLDNRGKDSAKALKVFHEFTEKLGDVCRNPQNYHRSFFARVSDTVTHVKKKFGLIETPAPSAPEEFPIRSVDIDYWTQQMLSGFIHQGGHVFTSFGEYDLNNNTKMDDLEDGYLRLEAPAGSKLEKVLLDLTKKDSPFPYLAKHENGFFITNGFLRHKEADHTKDRDIVHDFVAFKNAVADVSPEKARMKEAIEQCDQAFEKLKQRRAGQLMREYEENEGLKTLAAKHKADQAVELEFIEKTKNFEERKSEIEHDYGWHQASLEAQYARRARAYDDLTEDLNADYVPLKSHGTYRGK